MLAQRDTPLRVGLIGCGFFGENHAHAWQMVEGAVLAALCDRDLARATALADRAAPSVPMFDDIARMVDSAGIDILDIATSPETHAPLVLEAARLGRAAIVQKPLAPTYGEAAGAVAAMDRAGLPFMVHENFRFQAPLAELIETVRQGVIGEVTYARVAFRTGHDIYAGQPYLARATRFVLMDLGVHVLDVARAVAGEVERIACEVQSVRKGIAGEDSAAMLVRHAQGAVSVVECSYASPLPADPFPDVLVTVEGREGAILLETGGTLALREGGTERRWNASPSPAPWMHAPWQTVQDSVVRTQHHFVDALRTGREPDTSGWDNLHTLAAVEAAYEAAASGAPVRPRPVER